jgi:2-phosphosulfolactate phosphatase
MKIVVESLLDGARKAAGGVAVIDVFRAFTTAAVVLANGATRIIMVGSVEEAFSLRERGIVQACMGEVGGIAPPGFDLGNSPFEASARDFTGMSVAQRTSAGTQGIIAARGAEVLYAASFVTATCTARALHRRSAARITLVAMGHEGVERTDEDEVCALHLRNLLEGRGGDPEAVRRVILAGGEAARFLDPASRHGHPRDLDIALDIDRYGFAISVAIEDGMPVARIEKPACEHEFARPLRCL